MANTERRATFEFYGPSESGDDSEILGLWTLAPTPDASGISFDTDAPAAPSATIWRANLPADREQAGRSLELGEANLDAAETALTTALDRIDALVQQQQEPLAFDSTGRTLDLPQPEQDLLALLGEAQSRPRTASFAVDEQEPDHWEQALEEFLDFLGRLQRTFTHFQWVETQVEGELLVRSVVSWLGDLETVWHPDLDREQMTLHGRTLRIALASRNVMLRSLFVVAAGAGKLSVLITAPGGVVLALPAAWKFIKQIRAELEQMEALKSGI